MQQEKMMKQTGNTAATDIGIGRLGSSRYFLYVLLRETTVTKEHNNVQFDKAINSLMPPPPTFNSTGLQGISTIWPVTMVAVFRFARYLVILFKANLVLPWIIFWNMLYYTGLYSFVVGNS